MYLVILLFIFILICCFAHLYVSRLVAMVIGVFICNVVCCFVCDQLVCDQYDMYHNGRLDCYVLFRTHWLFMLIVCFVSIFLGISICFVIFINIICIYMSNGLQIVYFYVLDVCDMYCLVLDDSSVLFATYNNVIWST